MSQHPEKRPRNGDLDFSQWKFWRDYYLSQGINTQEAEKLANQRLKAEGQ